MTGGRVLRYAIVVLSLVEAGWMAFDGGRALVVGDYVTPASGPRAGQLGPWAGIVESLGIPPRSTVMKSAFLVYGLAWIGVAIAFGRGAGWARRAMLLLAAGSLWYLVPGTVLGAAQIVMLVLHGHGGARRSARKAPPRR